MEELGAQVARDEAGASLGPLSAGTAALVETLCNVNLALVAGFLAGYDYKNANDLRAPICGPGCCFCLLAFFRSLHVNFLLLQV